MREFVPGLEGVVAFETQIAEPDRDGGALRYRGVDVADLVGCVSFGNVWGLLVDGEFNPGIPPAEPFPIPIHSGDVRVDVQSAIAMLAPAWGLQPILDIDDDTARENLAHVSVMALSFVAQSARGLGQPMVPQADIDQANTVVERFMIRWRGEPDPRHVEAIDSYFVVAAEHGLNSSTLTARVSASTGTDVAAAISGAIGTMSGPLHGGAPARVLSMIEEVENSDDAATFVRETLDADKRLMGFGHRVYKNFDPRAKIIKVAADEVLNDLGVEDPILDIAKGLEREALADPYFVQRKLYPNVDFYSGIIYRAMGIPVDMFTVMFALGRLPGWIGQWREMRLRKEPIGRPRQIYSGETARSFSSSKR